MSALGLCHAALSKAPTGPNSTQIGISGATTKGIIARTRAGLAPMESAARDGALVIEQDITARDMGLYQSHQVDKKLAVWARHAGLKTAGRLVPEVRRLGIEELARKAGLAANLREARGIRRRARQGRTTEPRPRSS